MIVRVEHDSFLLITQPDHAALAAAIMSAWQADDFPDNPRRDVVLDAVREHDNGWQEPDAAPSVNAGTGEPMDFIAAPLALREAIWPRAVDRLAHAGKVYQAALVAQHALVVHRRFASEPAWHDFFARVTASRDAQLETAGVIDPSARAAFRRDYAIVSTGDAISLTFCNGWTAPQKTEGHVLVQTGARVEIRPDPFSGQTTTLRAAARRLPRRRYTSDADLQESFDAAPIEWIDGEAAGCR